MRPLFISLLAVAAGCGGNVIPDMGTMNPPVEAKFSSLYANYLNQCANCHAPGSPGAGTMGIEMTLNFASAATAFSTISTGKAMGLVGNQKECNGVSFVTPMMPARSLLVAVLDAPTRAAFDLPSAPLCAQLTITDETVKLSAAPTGDYIAKLKQWIMDGAANN
jgi:hypothetical protein